jgi:hypothetical protein
MDGGAVTGKECAWCKIWSMCPETLLKVPPLIWVPLRERAIVVEEKCRPDAWAPFAMARGQLIAVIIERVALITGYLPMIVEDEGHRKIPA